MKIAKSAAGFALIEVLVAMLLFSIGVLGMVAMEGKASQYSGNAEDRTRAALMANEIVSLMWAKNTTSLPAADLSAWQARVQDPTVSGVPGGVGSISAPDADGVVTVTITWVSVSKTAAVSSASSSAASSASASSSASSSAAPATPNSIYMTKVVIPPDSGFSSSSSSAP